jgi:hypothetical protein
MIDVIGRVEKRNVAQWAATTWFRNGSDGIGFSDNVVGKRVDEKAALWLEKSIKN